MRNASMCLLLILFTTAPSHATALSEEEAEPHDKVGATPGRQLSDWWKPGYMSHEAAESDTAAPGRQLSDWWKPPNAASPTKQKDWWKQGQLSPEKENTEAEDIFAKKMKQVRDPLWAGSWEKTTEEGLNYADVPKWMLEPPDYSQFSPDKIVTTSPPPPDNSTWNGDEVYDVVLSHTSLEREIFRIQMEMMEEPDAARGVPFWPDPAKGVKPRWSDGFLWWFVKEMMIHGDTETSDVSPLIAMHDGALCAGAVILKPDAEANKENATVPLKRSSAISFATAQIATEIGVLCRWKSGRIGILSSKSTWSNTEHMTMLA
eukprot:gnl/TRDRNA2_/TRDRNA2_147687_c0_seq1.p1 gnl/TRDRNA2_/TRDRNA2_147687_c0~~gnl/TRDRNA2_/TRDRNA2_147687_c0_seq1.p1  ORF type:complete len:318 (-),score=58.77 gnl/TRDRNA2_/TRDRNA2_147687_c0_seq1:71-1024(-)